MESRPNDGEIMGSNCEEDGDCQPPPEDRSSVEWNLDFTELGIYSKHPSGGQLVGWKYEDEISGITYKAQPAFFSGSPGIFVLNHVSAPDAPPSPAIRWKKKGDDEPEELTAPRFVSVTNRNGDLLFIEKEGAQGLVFYELKEAQTFEMLFNNADVTLTWLDEWNRDELFDKNGECCTAKKCIETGGEISVTGWVLGVLPATLPYKGYDVAIKSRAGSSGFTDYLFNTTNEDDAEALREYANDPERLVTLVGSGRCSFLLADLISFEEEDCTCFEEVFKAACENMSIVQDTDGKLYLITMRNHNGKPSFEGGKPVIGLFEIEQTGSEFKLKFIQKRSIVLKDLPLYLGDFQAGATFYVSPKGRLILYTVEHYPQAGSNKYIDGCEIGGSSSSRYCNQPRLGELASSYFVEVEKRYSQTDVCFERDNDGDGQFNEDPVNFDVYGEPIDDDTDGLFNEDDIDCPTGTSLGTDLDNDGQGTFTIEAVLKKNGTVLNYTPGRYYAVSTVRPVSDRDTLWIAERYGECTEQTPRVSKLHPPSGGGAVVVVVVGPDGIARQIANANTLDYTDLTSGITVVDVAVTDTNAEAHLKDVPKDYTIYLYVKFAPGLKGENFAEGFSCDNETAARLEEAGGEFVATATLGVVDNK